MPATVVFLITMRTLLAALLSALCLIAHAANPPNVVIILADDLGYGDLGCFGSKNFKTPHIDSLAAEGTRLTHFHSPTPYCAPTRAALLTGRQPARCGLSVNPSPDGNPLADRIGLPAREITLAQTLGAAGYACGMVGKWHLGQIGRAHV